MKATCHREGLLSACQLVSVAVPARDIKPVLRNIKASAGPDRCTLMATDLELGIRLEVRGLQVQEPGDALLPAGRLLAILRESQDEELTIEADANACVVRGRYNEFEMPGDDPAGFPDFPDAAEGGHHEVAAGVLREMVRRTVFATAAESARYSMTGVLWELDGSTARLVATDGRRLALASGPATAHGGHGTQGQAPVVPTKALTLLERNLQDEGEAVRVAFRPNEVLFRTERAVVYSRLVEGRFPNYKEVMPKKAAAKVPLVAGPFLAAVRQAAIMTDDDSRRVVFHFAKNKLTLQAQGAATGRSKVELPVEYDGKALDVSFNPGFLVDMLRVLPADAEVTAELVDGATATLFRHGPDYLYLVMPLC
jgi:DNA polymerase-3 subunit beta